jgi:hypothetical protein
VALREVCGICIAGVSFVGFDVLNLGCVVLHLDRFVSPEAVTVRPPRSS